MKLVTFATREIDHMGTGATVRVERKRCKIGLRVLARKLGMSASYLSDLERGRRNWTKEQFDRIAKAIKGEKLCK